MATLFDLLEVQRRGAIVVALQIQERSGHQCHTIPWVFGLNPTIQAAPPRFPAPSFPFTHSSFSPHSLAFTLVDTLDTSLETNPVPAAHMVVAITATVAISSAVVGGAGVVTRHLLNSGQHESLSAYNPAPKRPRRQWVIATEEGSRNVRVCRYASEAAARAAFDKIWCARILFNPEREEVCLAGLGFSAHANIRQAMREGYFSRPLSPTRRALKQVMEVAVPIAAVILPLIV